MTNPEGAFVPPRKSGEFVPIDQISAEHIDRNSGFDWDIGRTPEESRNKNELQKNGKTGSPKKPSDLTETCPMTYTRGRKRKKKLGGGNA
jgi:hypothetical protein